MLYFEVRNFQEFQHYSKRKSGLLQKDGRVWFGDRHFDGPDEMYEWWRGNDSLPAQADECQGLLEFYS